MGHPNGWVHSSSPESKRLVNGTADEAGPTRTFGQSLLWNVPFWNVPSVYPISDYCPFILAAFVISFNIGGAIVTKKVSLYFDCPYPFVWRVSSIVFVREKKNTLYWVDNFKGLLVVLFRATIYTFSHGRYFIYKIVAMYIVCKRFFNFFCHNPRKPSTFSTCL